MPFNLPFLPTINNKKLANYENSVSSIWKSIKNIYGQLNVEYKNHDVQAGGSQSTTGTWTDLSAIAAGVTGGNGNQIDVGYRDGDKIRMKSLQFKFTITKQAANVLADTSHIMIFKRYNNFLSTPNDINDVYDKFTGPTIRDRLRRNEFRGQYKLIAHKVVKLSGLEEVDNEKTRTIYIRPKGRKGTHIEWEGTLGTDPSNGKYLLFDYSENGTNVIQWASRLTYVDN